MRTCKAKGCKTRFEASGFIVWCSPSCGSQIAQDRLAKKRAKARAEERRADRAKREKLKTRSDWLKDAQRAFNTFIRWRDRAAGWPCISSNKPLDWASNSVDAGHYRSTGAAPHLRFNEDNCHAQSKQENRYLAGNAIDYRVNLIARIGLARVEALESDQTPRHYSTDDLKAITKKYRALARELQRLQPAA